MFDVANRLLTNPAGFGNPQGLEQYTDKHAGIRITDWLNTRNPKINSKATNFLRTRETNRSVDISKDGKKIVFGAEWTIYCTDESGKKLWEAPVQGMAGAVNISANNKTVAGAIGNGTIQWYSMENEFEIKITGIAKNSIADKYGLKVGDIILKVNNIDIKNLEVFRENIKEQKQYNFEILRGGEKKIIEVNKTRNSFGFAYSYYKNHLLMTLYLHPDNKRWILYSPQGYFDCSPGAEELIGWHVNQVPDKEAKFYPMSRFYDKYYTPNLGERILAGEKISSDVSMSNFKLPPLVKITSPKNNPQVNKKELTVEVNVTDQGGGIDEVRLYVNDKLVQTTQRGFKTIEKLREQNTKTFDISLIKGENIIKATAFNNQRTESIPGEISVFYKGAEKTSDLFVLVIGINDYKNPRYKLNYAIADATGFKNEVEKGSRSIFGSVNINYLKNSEVTRERILQAFESLKSKANQEDVFVFYYAGHGVMSEEKESQFYIVPYDVTQLYGNNDMLKNKAISAEELQTFSTELKAQKQMFVFDACQSGGMTELLALRGAAEEKAIAQLARSTGTYWLAASSSQQFATEFSELGHGIFTYSIILGLQGRADAGSKDKKITIMELSAFINDKVPELSEKHKGKPQYPTSYGYGQDFPIKIIK